MGFFSRKKRHRYTAFAVSETGSLSGIEDRQEFLEKAKSLLESFLPGTPFEKLLDMDFSRMEILYPDEWESPTCLDEAEAVLSGETWNTICADLSKLQSNLIYDPKKGRTIHFVTPGRELAVFQFTVREK